MRADQGSLPRPSWLGVPALALSALALSAAPALGASQTATYQGWNDMHAAFAGRSLIVSDAATVRLDPRTTRGPRVPDATPFVYYRVEANAAALDRARLRFVRPPQERVSVRTSIGRMSSGSVGTDRTGRFLLVPGSTRFAAPVVHCCAGDTEAVLESDGRADALRPLVGTLDGPRRARWLSVSPEGALTLSWADPRQPDTRARTAFAGPPPAPGLVAMGGPLLAYARERDRATLVAARIGDEGAFGTRTRRMPGRIVSVAADRNTIAVAINRGGRFEVRRLNWPSLSGPVVWRGRPRPSLAVGGPTVAAAAGRVVLASRRGRLREIRRASGRVSAIAVDRTRAAVLERRRVRGRPVTVARLWRVP